MGASALDEGDLTRAVVGSYSALTTEEAQALGQPAAAAVLPLRRNLWRLAEQLAPARLAATLRARAYAPNDPTGRDGVKELRLAIADWLDPPPCCRWCRRPIRPGDEGVRPCTAVRGSRARARRRDSAPPAEPARLWLDAQEPASAAPLPRRAWTARPIACRPSRARARASGGGPAACGTLALYPAGYVSLEIMAAALAVPKGAASGYDVAADRDCRALLAATAAVPPRDPLDPDAWRDEALRLLHAAAARATPPPPAPALAPQLVAAREALDEARNAHIRVNGRIGLAVQLRYFAPRDGVTRADLTQGAMCGADRAVLDYDASKARFSTYGAAWMRQGCGEAWASRDVIGTPQWVLDLRRAVEARLRAHGAGVARDLLRAIEALAEVSHLHDAPALQAEPHGDLNRRGIAARLGRGDDRAEHVEGLGVGAIALSVHLESLCQGGAGLGGGVHVDNPTHSSGGSQAGFSPFRQNAAYSYMNAVRVMARDLARLLAPAEVIDQIPAGPRQPRQRRRLLFPDAAPAVTPDEHGSTPYSAAWALVCLAAEAERAARRPVPKRPPKAPLPPEDPERVRERIAAWVAARLEIGSKAGPGKSASGGGLLSALRHGAPVLVQIGAGGGDGEDEDSAQGLGDGAGGVDRAAAILAAPDELEAEEAEQDAAARWQAALSALAALRGSGERGDHRGPEAAEVIRRHHGLDSMHEDRSGAGGESFASIAETGLVCTGRRLSKEALRKIYNRGLAAMRAHLEGHPLTLGDADDDEDFAVPHPPRSPFRPLAPPIVVPQTATPPTPREAVDGGAWAAFREAAEAVTW